MSVNPSRWNPETYDPILTELHRHGLTDQEITGRMLDDGYPVSIQDVAAARKRLGLPANQFHRPQQPAIREKPNPVADAKLWLGRRLIEKRIGDRSEYRLDGTPTDLIGMMRAYNAMRKAAGAPQVLINPQWEAKA